MTDDDSMSRTAARPKPRDTPYLNGNARGAKRPRTPGSDGDVHGRDGVDDDDIKTRKRGRSSKPNRIPSTPPHSASIPRSTHTPQPKAEPKGVDSPVKGTPDRSTEIAPRVKIDVPVRDHTTDQLSPGGDDYLEKNKDPSGEEKVTETGHLTEGREYRCRTFHVRGRNEKLFMLATECARVLVFRDSYLLFNKNKSLHKIIASQAEKDHLIEQNILPYSYRSRQIAIVTARSMFRQFGAKMIVDGRRVKDDYWESLAIESGWTEDDPAVERKPPPRSAKEPGHDVSTVGATAMDTLHRAPLIYKDLANGAEPRLPSGIQQVDNVNVTVTRGDNGGLVRPRHDITGAAFEDRSQPSAEKEIVEQAAQAAQFNLAAAEGAKARRNFFKEYYLTPRTIPSPKLSPKDSPGNMDSAPPLLPLNYLHQSPEEQRTSQPPPSQLPRQASIPPLQHTPSQLLDQHRFARPNNQNPHNLMHHSPIHNMRPDQTPSSMQQSHRVPLYPFNNSSMGVHHGSQHSTPTPGGPGNMFYPQTSMPNMWPSQATSGALHSPPPHMQPRQQPSQAHAPFQQSPHLQNQNQGLMQGSPLGYQQQGMGIGNLPQGYPQLPRGLYQGGRNPAQGYMQQMGGPFGMGNTQQAGMVGTPQSGMNGMTAGVVGQGWGGGGTGGGGVGGGAY